MHGHFTTDLDLARCAAAAGSSTVGRALCQTIALGADGAPPELIQLLPAGRDVVGRDGRRWINPDPAALIAAFADNQADLPIDWEHSTEVRAPEGDLAPAAGWITGLELGKGGAVMARVQWTPRGAQSLAAREYRYISPVFLFDKSDLRILRFLSAGLTNQPNLVMPALNRRQERVMDPELLKALGLPETATVADVLAALNRLQSELAVAKNRAETPSLDKYVPRADYDAACNRASKAELELESERDKRTGDEIEGEIGDALKAGKITPATADYHRAACRMDGGLARFREFVKAAPVVAGDTNLGDRRPPEGGDVAANSVTAQVAAMFGNTIEDIKKFGND